MHTLWGFVPLGMSNLKTSLVLLLTRFVEFCVAHFHLVMILIFCMREIETTCDKCDINCILGSKYDSCYNTDIMLKRDWYLL